MPVTFFISVKFLDGGVTIILNAKPEAKDAASAKMIKVVFFI
jgi:hypothetical protein